MDGGELPYADRDDSCSDWCCKADTVVDQPTGIEQRLDNQIDNILSIKLFGVTFTDLPIDHIFRVVVDIINAVGPISNAVGHIINTAVGFKYPFCFALAKGITLEHELPITNADIVEVVYFNPKKRLADKLTDDFSIAEHVARPVCFCPFGEQFCNRSGHSIIVSDLSVRADVRVASECRAVWRLVRSLCREWRLRSDN